MNNNSDDSLAVQNLVVLFPVNHMIVS